MNSWDLTVQVLAMTCGLSDGADLAWWQPWRTAATQRPWLPWAIAVQVCPSPSPPPPGALLTLSALNLSAPIPCSHSCTLLKQSRCAAVLAVLERCRLLSTPAFGCFKVQGAVYAVIAC